MGSTKQQWVTLTIVRWEDFNPRTDVKRPSWFRVEYRMIEHPNFFDFSHGEFMAWIYMLAQACRDNSDTVRLSYAHAERVRGLSRKDIDGAIEKLQQLGMLLVDVTSTNADVTSTNAHVTSTNATEQDGTGRNGTERDGTETPAAHFDFEELYRRYPLKKGKAEGLARCRVQIKTRDDFDALARAIDRYAADVRANGTAAKYIKHFSSFIGTVEKPVWRDWLDADAGLSPIAPLVPISRAQEISRANQSQAERILKGEL